MVFVVANLVLRLEVNKLHRHKLSLWDFFFVYLCLWDVELN